MEKKETSKKIDKKMNLKVIYLIITFLNHLN